MRIVKCSKCGKIIHAASTCYHCGSNSGFDEVSVTDVHGNISEDYDRIESLIQSKKYDEVIRLSYKIIEWMPSLASVYWYRLLAKKHSSSAIELLSKGIDCLEDADFCNALALSRGEEHLAYEDIKRIVCEIRSNLLKAISEHEIECKSGTEILKISKTMTAEIESHRNKLMESWSDLERAEQKLYSIEMDCLLLMKEYKDELNKSAEKADAIKAETYRLEECTEEQLQAFQIRIGAIIQNSEEAKSAIEAMKSQHPWVKTYSQYVVERDKKAREVLSEIAALKTYESTIEQTLAVVDIIEERHKKALRAADQFDFIDAAELLGLSGFDEILHSSGVSVNAVVNASAEGWKTPPKEVITVSESSDSDDDEINMEEYYAAWGINMD